VKIETKMWKRGEVQTPFLSHSEGFLFRYVHTNQNEMLIGFDVIVILKHGMVVNSQNGRVIVQRLSSAQQLLSI
jgi:hypothetical protein